MLRPYVALTLVFTGLLKACASNAELPISAGIGPDPALPPPNQELIPRVHAATATGWSGGMTPLAAPGLVANAFAGDLDHPRWLYVLPNGDVLVAETNAPERPEDAEGIVYADLDLGMIALAKAGIVSGMRGPTGGFMLVRRPEQLTVADVPGLVRSL